jgi:hypothetical protein
MKLLGPLSRSIRCTERIRCIERRLFTKVITRMDWKLRDNSINSNYPSLEIIYCSTTLSNHDIIRLIRFTSEIKVGVLEWVLSLIYI